MPSNDPIDVTWTAAPEVYIDEPWLLMRWDPEHQCVFTEWKAFATSAEFRGALTKVVAVSRDKHSSSLVTDTRKLELVSDEDQWWIRQTWVPLAIEAGLRKIAVVMATQGLSKMAIERMFKGRPDPGELLVSRMFGSVADALIWAQEI